MQQLEAVRASAVQQQHLKVRQKRQPRRRRAAPTVQIKRMRTHLKASKFVVVKAGTSTVSHDDGTPSLPRLGAIVEAVSQLMR